MSEALPVYELYAIRYATRDAKRAEHFIGGDSKDESLNMDYVVWVAISEGRPILIDSGFSETVAKRRQRPFLRCPIESLKLLGIDPSDVKDVILTHLHHGRQVQGAEIFCANRIAGRARSPLPVAE